MPPLFRRVLATLAGETKGGAEMVAVQLDLAEEAERPALGGYSVAYRIHAAASVAMRNPSGVARLADPADHSRSLDTQGGWTYGQGGNLVLGPVASDAWFLHGNKGRPAGRKSDHVGILSAKETSETLTTDCHAQSAALVAVEATDGPPATTAFCAKDHGADAGPICPTLRAGGHDLSHANSGAHMAVLVSVGGTDGHADRKQFLVAVRRFTPGECLALQGFPRDYLDGPIGRGGKPLDDGPKYKMTGNSWCVPVVAWVFGRMDAEFHRSRRLQPSSTPGWRKAA